MKQIKTSKTLFPFGVRFAGLATVAALAAGLLSQTAISQVLFRFLRRVELSS